MKLALIGRSMISPFGLAISPRMPASWRICLNEPRAPELAIMKMGFSSSKCSSMAAATSSVRRVPDPDDRLVALLLGDQAHVVLVVDLGDLGPRTCSRISCLLGGMTTSFLETVMPACVAYLNPRSLNASRTSDTAVAP